MKVEGKKLVIRSPISDPPEPSKSGKSLVIATTRGKRDDLGDGRRQAGQGRCQRLHRAVNADPRLPASGGRT